MTTPFAWPIVTSRCRNSSTAGRTQPALALVMGRDGQPEVGELEYQPPQVGPRLGELLHGDRVVRVGPATHQGAGQAVRGAGILGDQPVAEPVPVGAAAPNAPVDLDRGLGVGHRNHGLARRVQGVIGFAPPALHRLEGDEPPTTWTRERDHAGLSAVGDVSVIVAASSCPARQAWPTAAAHRADVAVGCHVEIDDDGGVVAGAGALAGVPVDPRRLHPARQRPRPRARGRCASRGPCGTCRRGSPSS